LDDGVAKQLQSARLLECTEKCVRDGGQLREQNRTELMFLSNTVSILAALSQTTTRMTVA